MLCVLIAVVIQSKPVHFFQHFFNFCFIWGLYDTPFCIANKLVISITTDCIENFMNKNDSGTDNKFISAKIN